MSTGPHSNVSGLRRTPVSERLVRQQWLQNAPLHSLFILLEQQLWHFFLTGFRTQERRHPERHQSRFPAKSRRLGERLSVDKQIEYRLVDMLGVGSKLLDHGMHRLGSNDFEQMQRKIGIWKPPVLRTPHHSPVLATPASFGRHW